MSARQTARLHRHLGALSLAAVLAASGPALAQDIAAAEALFDRGLSDMQAGRYEAGCTALAESQRLDPRPGTLFTLATCEARWGRVATAFTRYGDYLRVFERLPSDQKALQGARPGIAKAQREKLQAEVPELTLSLPPGAPAGTVVRRNGEEVAAATLGVALPVDPGEYLLSTRAPGGPVWERRITVGKAEKKHVTLDVKAPPAVVPGPADAAAGRRSDALNTGPSGARVGAFVAGGAGVAGLVAGGVLGGLALAQKGIVDRNCGASIGLADDGACNRTGLDAANSAKALALGSTIALAAGAVGVGAAVVLFVADPGPRKSGAAPGGWVSAGVLSASPTGGLVGAQGAF